MFYCVCMLFVYDFLFFFFFKQKTAYEMRISDWSSDVCSSDLFRFRIINGSMAAIHVTGIDTPVAQGAKLARIEESETTSLDSIGVGLAKSSIRSEERRVGKECVSTCRYRC